MISNLIFGIALVILLALLRVAYNTIRIYITYKRRYGDKVKFLFYPLLGLKYFMDNSLKNHDDAHYYLKETFRQNPNLKALIILSGFMDIFMANDNDWVKYISQDQKLFYKADAMFAYDMFFGEGLAFCSYNKWKRQRLFLNSSFHFEALKSRLPVIKEEVKNFCPQIKSGDGYLKINCFEEIKLVTSEILTKSFFGCSLKDVKCKNGKILSLEMCDITTDCYIHRVSSIHFIIKAAFLGCAKASKVLLSPAEKKLLVRVRDVCEIVEKQIDKKITEMEKIEDIQSFKATNFIEIYLKEYVQQQKNVESYKKDDLITKAELVQQYISFFFAGTDTTAQLTSMCLFEIANNPQIKEKLLKEIQQTGKSFDQIEASDLSRLPYLDAILKEAGRKYSVIPFLTPRKMDQNYEREDLFIDKSLLASYRMVKYSEEKDVLADSDKFLPERYMDQEKLRQLNPFDIIPFASGERVCIGQHMAIMEAKCLILHTLTHFEIAPVPNYKLRMFQFFIYSPVDQELIQIKVK